MSGDMSLRVVYDYDIFMDQRYGGISRSFVEVFRQFGLGKEVEPWLPFPFSRNAYLHQCSCYGGITIDMRLRGLPSILKAVNGLVFLPALQLGNADLYHQTFYNGLLAQLRPDIPLVVTVHDMTPELYPEHFEDPSSIHLGKQKACERATAVVCVSENTKEDLQRIYDLDSEKLYVVHHGGGTKTIQGEESLDTPPQYVLYVGKRKGYKNFSELSRALIPLMERRPELHLVCVGGERLRSEEVRHYEQKGLDSRVHHDFPSDRKLASYYRNAEVFVYPSLYEGFGLPILESFRNRCPVVVSRCSCFPEIAGEAAAYFEPGDTGSLKVTIERVLEDRAYRRTLIERGVKRAEHFSWERAADRLQRLYQRVVHEK